MPRSPARSPACRRGREVTALYAGAIASAESGLAALRASYETGRAELGEVLLAQRALVEARLASARARADLALAAVDLARATGAPLPGGETP